MTNTTHRHYVAQGTNGAIVLQSRLGAVIARELDPTITSVLDVRSTGVFREGKDFEEELRTLGAGQFHKRYLRTEMTVLDLKGTPRYADFLREQSLRFA